MLYVDDGKLKADEVKVVGAGDVEALISDGWRILGIVGQSFPGPTNSAILTWHGDGGQANNGSVQIPGQPVFTPQFIMGRDSENAKLHQRVLDAEADKAEAVKHAEKLEKEDLGELREKLTERDAEVVSAVERVQLVHERLNSTQVKLDQMEKETAVVRREVGEGKWREIISALHVEQALEAERQVEDDEDVPF